MLCNDLPYFIKTSFLQKLPTGLGMIFACAETSRFGNVMQQRRCPYQFKIQVDTLVPQFICQTNGHTAHLLRVIYNMIHHAHLPHEPITFFLGWYLHGADCLSVPLMSACRLFAAEYLSILLNRKRKGSFITKARKIETTKKIMHFFWVLRFRIFAVVSILFTKKHTPFAIKTRIHNEVRNEP
jgi:hypothetical protein